MTDQELMVKGCEFLGVSEEEFWELLKRAREKYPEYVWGSRKSGINHTGLTYDRLFVLYRTNNNSIGKPVWVCVCQCPKHSIVSRYATSLRSDKFFSSCGCLSKEMKKMHNAKRTHGASKTRLFYIWKHMRARCYCKTNKKYKSYGGRGITICEEWDTYEAFRDWALNNGYQDDLTIDRIDNNGNYSPINCRWADATTQQNNKRNCRYYTYLGETLTISQWARKCDINRQTLYSRLKRGMDIEEALTTPVVKTVV